MQEKKPVEKSEIRIAEVSLSYGDQKILDNVSFTLKAGRILALIGPNGAGKSSTMRVMAGLVKPDSGHALMNERPLTFSQLRSHMGYFIESPSFYSYLNAKENLDMLIRIQGSKQSSEELIEKVGLTHATKKRFSQYSTGMKQRLGIAQTLIGKPQFLILDEPFNGLDPEVKELFMQMIIDLAHKNGTGVLITSHLLADLERMADDFVLLNQGKIHLEGRVSDFINEKQRVKLLFNESVEFLDLPEGVELLECRDNILIVNATARQTEEMLLKLASKDLAPYSVNRSDLLHEKYMEIAK